MTEAEMIAYNLGIFADDELKMESITGFILEAEEFMQNSGVKKIKLNTSTAKAVKSLWAESRLNNKSIDLTGKDRMVVSLISQLKR